MDNLQVGQKVRLTASVEDLRGMAITFETESLVGAEGTIDRFWTDDVSGEEWALVDFGNGRFWFILLKFLEAAKAPIKSPVKPVKVKPAKAPKVKVRPATVPKVKPQKIGLAHAIRLYPQTRKVLAHMETHGSISPLEAFGVYRVTRLAARIKEIRDAGVKVATTIKQDATGTRYAEYTLAAVA